MQEPRRKPGDDGGEDAGSDDERDTDKSQPQAQEKNHAASQAIEQIGQRSKPSQIHAGAAGQQANQAIQASRQPQAGQGQTQLHRRSVSTVREELLHRAGEGLRLLEEGQVSIVVEQIIGGGT